MFIITGGTYNDRNYSCMYNPSDLCYHQDRYDETAQLIGITGSIDNTSPMTTEIPAMLWFSGKDPGNLKFEKGELYFPDIDMTISELEKETSYNLDEFEPVDSQGYAMEGCVTYKNKTYPVYVSIMDQYAGWHESVMAGLADQLKNAD